jgi:SAM-dependent methyltransferase
MKEKNNLIYKLSFPLRIGIKMGLRMVRALFDNTFAIKNIYFNKAIVIGYEKFEDAIPNPSVGYLDIAEVERRYDEQMKSFNIEEEIKNNASIRDNVFFLEKECGRYFFEKGDFKLLDVGCGSGVYSKIFGREGSKTAKWQYAGTEIDEKLIEVCKKYSSKKIFFTSTSDKLEALDDSFDLVFSSGVMHYTLDCWKKSILEMRRVSKKYIAITRFPLAKFAATFYVKQTVRSISGTEVHYFICINRNEFEEFLKENGLSIVKRDYSLEEYTIKGIKEKIILTQYLLEKQPNA